MTRLPRWGLVLVLLLSAAFVPAASPARAARTPASVGVDTVLSSATFNFLVVDNARGRVYASEANGTVAVIDAAKDTFLKWVTVGTVAPTSMDLAFNGSELFVSVPGLDDLQVINLTTDTIARTLHLTFSPGDVAAGRPGRAYVGSWGYASYPQIVDTDTGAVVGPITAAGQYYQDPVVRISRDRATLYTMDREVAPTSLEKISVTTDQPVLLGATPWGIDSASDAYVSPDGAYFYYPNPAAYLVQVFPTSPWNGVMTSSLNTGPYPRSVCLAQFGRIAFAVAASQTELYEFDAPNGTLIGTLMLAGDPSVVRALENGTRAYVISSAGLEAIDTGISMSPYPTPSPVAVASTTGGYIPLAATFYSSIMGGTAPYNETWDLGDGTMAYGPTANHVYTTTGSFAVNLVARDSKGATGSAHLTLVTAVPPGPNPLAFGLAFGGASYDPNTDPWVPPDPQIAVGLADIVEMVNTRYMIWDRLGSYQGGGDLTTLFNISSSQALTDPRVVYDPSTLRFFASVADFTTGQVLLATSSLDPTHPWTVTSLASRSGCPDQPYLGVAAAAIVISDNGFSSCASSNPTFLGAEYWVINKTDLILRMPLVDIHVGPNAAFATLFPATIQSYDPNVYLATVGWAWNVTTSLELVKISGTPPGTVSFTNTTLTVRPIVQPPNGIQPYTTLQVNTGDSRIQQAFLRGGHLWLSLGDACLPPAAAANRSCARILEIDPAKAAVLQDFDIGDPAADLYYPAIALDGAGDLVTVYGFSSGTAYPGVRVSAQLAGDAPNTSRAPVLVQSGSGPAVQGCPDGVSCRYGDYFGAAIDPVDPEAVWTVGEYEVSSGWQTTIAEVGVFAQVQVTLSYSLLGGGSPALLPQILLFSRGVENRFALSATPYSYAMDAGSPWAVSPFLHGGPGERWLSTSLPFGIAANGTSETVDYQRQFQVTVASSPQAGGSVSPSSGWFDANTTLSVTANATAGWKLVGWTGQGAGSYSGTTGTANVVVASPLTETALFDPGLTISAGPGGSVSYSYGNVSGIVPAGGTATVYVPNGTQVTLSAASDALDQFAGWQGGAAGNGLTVRLTMNGPAAVRASFSLSATGTVVTGGIGAAIVAGAVLAVLLLRRRRRNAPPPPTSPPPAPPSAPLSSPPSAPPESPPGSPGP